MSIKVLVNGAFGRMGLMAAKAIENHPSLMLSAQTGRNDDLHQAIMDSQAEVVVDFTQPDAVFSNTRTIINAGSRPIIGTSGLTQNQINSIKQQCANLKRGGIIAANFSLGAVLMMKLAQQIAPYFSAVEIIEKHHAGKVDSPSGTSLRSAQLIATANPKLNQNNIRATETIPHARGATHEGIPIHSLRLPGLLAHQEIVFGSIGETLTLRHDTSDRQCFMAGLCLACEKVMQLNYLACGLEEII